MRDKRTVPVIVDARELIRAAEEREAVPRPVVERRAHKAVTPVGVVIVKGDGK